MTPTSPRTLLLTERRPRRCRLAPEDVAFLLGHHRTHLEVAPTGRRDVYRLTPRGYAGVLVAPGCRLVIRPKVSLDNLFFLLEPTAPVASGPDRVTPVPGGEVLDFLAGQLARGLAGRSAAGLHRGYRERAEQGPFLHGRLDLPAQLREGPGRKEQLHCRHDDFTVDVPCNRALKAAAAELVACPLVGDEARAALRRALVALEEVRAWLPGPEDWDRLLAERLPAEYLALLGLGRLLVDGLAPGGRAGPAPAPSFLVDMERVWERHVTRAVVGAFAGGESPLGVQAAYTVGHDTRGRPVVMRPDVTVGPAGRPELVVDAKWKRPAGGAATEDLYQVLAYGTALGAGRVVLVYPGRRDGAREYAFPHAAVRVTVRTLRVEGPRAALARSARRLGAALARACRQR
jgi:5-methylcytosine-specific restriction enzyme subunit McrC